MTSKELGRLQRTMNELLQSGLNDDFRSLLDKNAELIRTTREKGIVTMVLRFAILERNDTLIVSLFDRLSMKRDYFALMVYNPDREYCIHLFTRYIDAALLDSKDIRFMIENRLAFLFRYLDGKFLHDSEAFEAPPCDLSCLSRYSLQGCDYYIQKIVSRMEKNPKNKFQKHVPILKKLKQINYNAIIDGGNVLHSRNGITCPDDLNTMIQIVRLNGCNPLVVIHKSHTDEQFNPSYAPRINQMLRDVPHIVTPAGMNDDLFILIAYLMRIQGEQQQQQPQQPQQEQQEKQEKQPSSRVCIITRDTYTDHMDTFKKTDKNVSDDFGKYLASDLVSFVNTHGQLHLCGSIVQPFSHCIQIVEPYAYIPLPVQDPSHRAFTFRKIQM
jgi:hypothetical protein